MVVYRTSMQILADVLVATHECVKQSLNHDKKVIAKKTKTAKEQIQECQEKKMKISDFERFKLIFSNKSIKVPCSTF